MRSQEVRLFDYQHVELLTLLKGLHKALKDVNLRIDLCIEVRQLELAALGNTLIAIDEAHLALDSFKKVGRGLHLWLEVLFDRVSFDVLHDGVLTTCVPLLSFLFTILSLRAEPLSHFDLIILFFRTKN